MSDASRLLDETAYRTIDAIYRDCHPLSREMDRIAAIIHSNLREVGRYFGGSSSYPYYGPRSYQRCPPDFDPLSFAYPENKTETKKETVPMFDPKKHKRMKLEDVTTSIKEAEDKLNRERALKMAYDTLTSKRNSVTDITKNLTTAKTGLKDAEDKVRELGGIV
jgi:hypothetical protein